MKKKLSLLLAGAISISMAVPSFAETENSRKIYVSLNGNDTNNGTSMTQAVKTVAQAQKLARLSKNENKKIEIILDGGVYEFDEAFALTVDDSGVSADKPIVYRPYRGEDVSFTRAKKLDASKFDLVKSDDPNYSIITDKENTYVADLSEFANIRGGQSVSESDIIPSNEVIYQNGMMGKIAQWTGELEQVGKSEGKDMAYTFHIPEDKIGKWTSDLTNVYVGGFVNGWTYTISRVKDIDKSVINANDNNKEIQNTINVPFYQNEQRLLNLLCEIDEQGEYYVDAANKKLYYYPIGGSLEDIYLADNRDPKNRLNQDKTAIVSMNGTKHIRFEGIDFFGTGGRAFDMVNCDDVVIYDSTMRAIALEAVGASGTTNLQILKSTFTDLQAGALKISGGNQATLTSSNNIVKNCNISNLGVVYKTGAPGFTGYGITINGVGTTIINNEFYNMPAMAISIDGSDNIIKNNRIRNASKETRDNSVIYLGRSYIDRGNQITDNYIFWDKSVEDYASVAIDHYIGLFGTDIDTQAIYLDDLQSGVTVTGNVIYNISRGLLMGGGENNTISDNAIIDCRKGALVDAEGANNGYRAQHLSPEGTAGGNLYKAVGDLLNSAGYDEDKWNEVPGYAELVKRYNTLKTNYEEFCKNVIKTTTNGTTTYETSAEAVAAYMKSAFDITMSATDGNGNTKSNQAARAEAVQRLGSKYFAPIASSDVMENNLYTGPWAQSWDESDAYDVRQDWTVLCGENRNNWVEFSKQNAWGHPQYNKIYSQYDFKDFETSSEASKSGKTGQMHSGTLMSDADAGVLIDSDYNIKITNAPAGVPKSTDGMGIGVDDYASSVDLEEISASDNNRFTVIAAIYDNNHVLKKIEMKNDVFFYNGQIGEISIDVPQEANENWFAKLMLWDNIKGLRPVSEVIPLNSK